jgi:hypothetical protein
LTALPVPESAAEGAAQCNMIVDDDIIIESSLGLER